MRAVGVVERTHWKMTNTVPCSVGSGIMAGVFVVAVIDA